MRWSNSVLTALLALLAGASFGYLMPHSAAGKEEGRWIPLGFEKGMGVFTRTLNLLQRLARSHSPRLRNQP